MPDGLKAILRASPDLSRLAAAHDPSVYPAWRPVQSFSNS
ncbi:hypothetical protein HMPREF9080_02021 [Cardiobacterium valvarum F0432]|uniref:Uncharacterized protein n=1 Tax=Cardiobacterium valvarum F0432 TaxID=797473 RepID=G9ZGW4_9GAMM|nr:hypothetical protein HMPREF9080_02021 [Cardiobacterium valvarum F0432]